MREAVWSACVFAVLTSGSESLARDALVVDTFGPEINGGAGGLEVDGSGNVYFADYGALLSDPAKMGRTVYRLDPQGRISVFAFGFAAAAGNSFDPNGNLLQANHRTGSIHRVRPNGTVEAFVAGGLEGPVGVVAAPDHRVFVANCWDDTVAVVDQKLSVRVYAESPLFACPNGIALDHAGNVYVSNFDSGQIVRVDSGGRAEVLATLPGENNGHIVFHETALYVAARGEHQIYEVSLDGTVRLLAGSGELGREDGPALKATFSFPNDLAFSPDGRYLYVNEVVNREGSSEALSPMGLRRITLTAR